MDKAWLVTKETMVLRWWGVETNTWFIDRVDNVVNFLPSNLGYASTELKFIFNGKQILGVYGCMPTSEPK